MVKGEHFSLLFINFYILLLLYSFCQSSYEVRFIRFKSAFFFSVEVLTIPVLLVMLRRFSQTEMSMLVILMVCFLMEWGDIHG